MKKEFVDVVDEKDNVLCSVSRSDMREKNLLHRDVKIFVLNSKGEFFIQKRSMKKDIYPGYFSFGVAGTVKSGEDYVDTAKRELEEEIGFKDADLKFVFKFKYETRSTKVISSVFSCVFDGKVKLQKSEVDEGFFVGLSDAKKLMKTKKFTPDGIFAFNKFLKGYKR